MTGQCQATTRRGARCKRPVAYIPGYCHDHWHFDTGCVDCGWLTMGGRDGVELYMVHHDLWQAAGMEPYGGKLCVDCLETRIGRRLTPADFNDAPCNQPDPRDTPRLAARKQLEAKP